MCVCMYICIKASFIEQNLFWLTLMHDYDENELRNF